MLLTHVRLLTKIVLGAALASVLASCSLLPSGGGGAGGRVSSRIDRITLAQDVTAFEFAHRDYRKTEYTLTAGDYEQVLDSRKALYFLNKAADVRVAWPAWKNRARPDRSAPGGLMYSKDRGLWFVFTLGSADGMDVEGEPPIKLETKDKIFDRLVNPGALLGRLDKNGRLVKVETEREAAFYGEPTNLDAITIVTTTASKR
jgi:hypothetical protein